MSRLDRLLSLLETGSSGVTRKAAALQLGEVQRLHPHELHNLLSSVLKYLRHQVWDTRIAAGQAIEAILNNVPPWQPIGTTPEDGGNENVEMEEDDCKKKLSFKTFDFHAITSKSAHLVGSEGKEYDSAVTKKECDTSDANSLEKQKESLNAKLGLNMCSKLGFNTDNLYSNDDFKIHYTDNSETDKVNVGEVVGLSNREMNRARRKAKQALLRQRSVPACQDETETNNPSCLVKSEYQPDAKKIKLEPGESVEQTSAVQTDALPVPDNTGYWPPEAVSWPLDWFCEKLLSDLFSTSWEVRHGGATGIRHLIKTHGKDGGRSSNISSDQMTEFHQCWLEDIALRLVCVLTLDRFGDFVSDQVVAPVRETCAQALGSVSAHMSEDRVIELVKILIKLLHHEDWETRHGGLLGIKYVFAVKQDLLESLLKICLDDLHSALTDKVDDVGAVAGAALSLSVNPLTKQYPNEAMKIFHTLASHIPELDDLTPAANTFIPLVIQLLTHQDISSQLSVSDEVERLVVRVWSLLDHNNSSVRKAALQTLSALPAHQNIQLLQKSLRHIYQRALFEHSQTVISVVYNVWCDLISKSDISDVLLAACPFMTHWFCLAMQPVRLPYENSLLLRSKHQVKDSKTKSNSGIDVELSAEDVNDFKVTELKMYIGGNETIPVDQRESNALRARYLACKMLGFLSKFIVVPAPDAVYKNESESPISIYVNVLLVYLNSKSSLQRFISGLVISEWARISPPTPVPTLLVDKLNECLNVTIYYDEICVAFTKSLQDTKDFIALLKHYEIPDIQHLLVEDVFTFDQMESMCDNEVAKVISQTKLKRKVLTSLDERRIQLNSSIKSCREEYDSLNVMTLAALAGALLHLGQLPEKLGYVVKPLMDCIKREENYDLQELGANNLAKLIEDCLNRNSSTVSKIITNLCNYLRSDTEFTPRIEAPYLKILSVAKLNNMTYVQKPKKNNKDQFNGILTLIKHQRSVEKALLKRSNSSSGRGPGRPPITLSVKQDLPEDDEEAPYNKKLNEIQRRGSTLALISIVKKFGNTLPEKLPLLWTSIVQHLNETIDPQNCSQFETDPEKSNNLIGVLQVLEITAVHIHQDLVPKILDCFDRLVCLLYHPYSAVRHMSARCIASISLIDTSYVMTLVIKKILPMLGASENNNKRQGSMESIFMLMEKLQLQIVPYITFLIIPVLGCMSDQDDSVRKLATHTFASLIQLMPLDGETEDSKLSPELLTLKSTKRSFLHQLFNPKQIEDYKVPVPINAQLRSYQQAGVNWLWFLNKYNLHGILCDDMGLGKTIQSICILAGDHYNRRKRYKSSGDMDCAPLPSLVVCPPTLTGHWVFEIEKFISKKYLNPLQYVGNPVERQRLRCRVDDYNVIIASYDIVRKDIYFFSDIRWNYCILDEGHIIKNGKAKSTIAIKQLQANHRLILSGTPIQNNVLELWSLFDFLMPGFLGTEKQFMCRYSKPILASRDPKSTPKEQEAGVLAMEGLHRQVLPFVLRRLKEDVLKELPPKITQDYYCELSPLQKQLYEDFSKSTSQLFNIEDNVKSNQYKAHVFSALRYMQAVCNHPKLALLSDNSKHSKHPQYESIMSMLKAQNSSLSDINHAAKLPALKQLLIDCGIGVENDNNGDSIEDSVVNQHRALIFCQVKTMLDILENDFFRVHMPRVSFLRLDGSLPASSRNSVVTLFNNDPSIDVLLLTTQVGGLGLNLTGADTVIFIEHDWSPMRDLQAMDRAHRIGQKKVVNVYRLITKGTLEEKIMGLQKFKLFTANTVISSENASLETMGTDKLFDLFANKSAEEKGQDLSISGQSGSSGGRSSIDNLPPLWDQSDYDQEYDMNHFLNSLKP